MTTKERFIAKYIIQDNGCMIWTASTGDSGYGRFGMNGKMYRAHRASYELFVGNIPKGKFILHTCDDRLCVNPEHLKAGTQKENMQECIKRGRDNSPKGENHWGSKLNNEQVLEIRRLRFEEKWIYQRIADFFGVTVPGVWQICNGQRWTHI